MHQVKVRRGGPQDSLVEGKIFKNADMVQQNPVHLEMLLSGLGSRPSVAYTRCIHLPGSRSWPTALVLLGQLYIAERFTAHYSL